MFNEVIKWHKLNKRPLTEEEKEYYKENYLELDSACMYDCELPDDGDEVLVQLPGGVVSDIFYSDEGIDFEGCSIDDAIAWAYMPDGIEVKE